MRDYRHKVQILKRTNERDDYGEIMDCWSTYKEVWASKEPLLGKEFFTAFTTDNKIEIKFNMRFVPGVTPEMRIQSDGQVYEILGQPVDVKGLGRELLCYCRQVRE